MSKQESRRFIVAIDGPAGSGKSTTARLTARKLGWLYLDTGAMYRAITVKVLKEKIPLDDTEAIVRVAENSIIRLQPSEIGMRVFIDDDEVTSEIRRPEVDKAVGPVCEIEGVRRRMVEQQRKMGQESKLIAEGRDMTTVVFPDADLKFYLTASLEERARRRQKDLEGQNIFMPLDRLMKEIEKRDLRDSSRRISPLRKAEDAILVDTTDMSIEDQVSIIIKHIRDKMNQGSVK